MLGHLVLNSDNEINDFIRTRVEQLLRGHIVCGFASELLDGKWGFLYSLTSFKSEMLNSNSDPQFLRKIM
jgi:hypothetical protein